MGMSLCERSTFIVGSELYISGVAERSWSTARAGVKALREKRCRGTTTVHRRATRDSCCCCAERATDRLSESTNQWCE
ncbi:hypothetical protein Q5P01_009702 [Channa striata]|uniref:Uncharacterized protein n=1 Tax=Channa striata TaxID=64152 RepID=A0AA88MWC4_CHASR|nr:hypothetical protein Q5P01_009702 [Channa striata]